MEVRAGRIGGDGRRSGGAGLRSAPLRALLLAAALLATAAATIPAAAAPPVPPSPGKAIPPGVLSRTPFPLTLPDDRGTAVRLAAPPRRVVSLAPSLTETVYSLGKGELLVGATRFCNRPEAAKALPRVGGVADPDPERVISLRPDLVLATTDGNPKEKVLAIEAAGIPVFCLSPQDLEQLYRSVERLGTLLGDVHEGRRAAARLRRRAAEARRAAVGKGPSPKVLFAVSASPLVAAGAGTFLDEVVRLSGGTNAAAAYATRYPRLSVEEVVSLAPDVALLASMQGSEAFPPDLLRWREVPAFRDNAVRYLDGDLVTRPGPGLVDALEEVSRLLGAWRKGHAPPPRPHATVGVPR